MAHSAARRRRMSEGARRADRSRLVREHYRHALAALTRTGYIDCVRPQIRERALREALEQIAATTPARTPEGAAVRAVLARTPQAFSMFLRRNRDFTVP